MKVLLFVSVQVYNSIRIIVKPPLEVVVDDLEKIVIGKTKNEKGVDIIIECIKYGKKISDIASYY